MWSNWTIDLLPILIPKEGERQWIREKRTIEEISPMETLVHTKHRRNDAKLMDRVG